MAIELEIRWVKNVGKLKLIQTWVKISLIDPTYWEIWGRALESERKNKLEKEATFKNLELNDNNSASIFLE